MIVSVCAIPTGFMPSLPMNASEKLRATKQGVVPAPAIRTSSSPRLSPVLESAHRARLPWTWLLAWLLALGTAGLLSTSCSSRQVRAAERYHYRFEHGKTALIQDNLAWAPSHAPDPVHRAIEAGNELQGRPYRYGGGHARFEDSGYDCSGTVSYVLNKAGLLSSPLTSSAFLDYGKPGHGRWITIYAREGHAFVTIAGLRLDTGGTNEDTGPQWKPFSRKTSSFVVRHPPGL